MGVATDYEKAKNETTRPWWRFGSMAWALIGGLILLNAGFLFGGLDWDKRTIGWLIYRIDPRYWPQWPVPVLWGIVAWLAIGPLNRFAFIQRKQGWIKTGIAVAVVFGLLWYSGWTFVFIKKQIYFGVYINHVMGPISHYMFDGELSWKLAIVPTLATVTIAFLISVAIRERRRNHGSKCKNEVHSETTE